MFFSNSLSTLFSRTSDPPEIPKKLSSLSSICVLEYLSFDKRQYIVSQIPEFRNVEKSLPLHLNHLAIFVDKIQLDGNAFFLKSIFRRKQNFDAKFEKLVFDLIGNRPMIFTKKLEFGISPKMDSWIYQLIESLKIKAEAFQTSGFSLSYEELNRISNILGPEPLEEFSTKLDNYETLAHPIVRNSEKLVLYSGGLDFNHHQISHRNIHLKNYHRYELLDFLNEWDENDNLIGRELSGDIKVFAKNYRKLTNLEIDEEEKSIKEIMYSKKCESGGRRVKPDKRFPNTLYSITMPRTNNPNTEIQMSLIKNESNDYQFQIHLKAQPSGTATPQRFDSMNWELKIREIRKIFRIGEHQSFLHMIAFSMYLICGVLSVLLVPRILSEKQTFKGT
ncbi:unnamed protein product [Caenorhabditis nigoni]